MKQPIGLVMAFTMTARLLLSWQSPPRPAQSEAPKITYNLNFDLTPKINAAHSTCEFTNHSATSDQISTVTSVLKEDSIRDRPVHKGDTVVQLKNGLTAFIGDQSGIVLMNAQNEVTRLRPDGRLEKKAAKKFDLPDGARSVLLLLAITPGLLPGFRARCAAATQ